MQSLRHRAQRELGVGLCQLVSSSGKLLPELSTIGEAGLKHGDVLTAAVRQPEIAATLSAFALLRADGTAVTWGEMTQGGDSSGVQDQLEDVLEIQAADYAFAARRADGRVVTWGSQHDGGDSSDVQEHLIAVEQIQAAERAFAARLADGCVVTWGDKYAGGDSSAVRNELHQVREIQASRLAFAALREDGSVVSWGHPDYAGDSGPVREKLKEVKQIQASWGAFAALLSSGAVVTWGDRDYGGDSRAVSSQLKNVRQIQSDRHAFAAVLEGGDVVSWGHPSCGGLASDGLRTQLRDVQQVQSSDFAFIALRRDGSAVTWGDPEYGGDSRAVQEQLRHVKQLQSTDGAVAAVLNTGGVVTWGDSSDGGDSSQVQAQLRDVRLVQASSGAFAALLGDGSVIAWGAADRGGDCSAVREQLTNVQHIQATRNAFAAVAADGKVYRYRYDPVSYDGKWTKSSIRKWLEDVSYPPVNRLQPQFAPTKYLTKNPFGVLLVVKPVATDTDDLAKALEPHAHRLADRLKVTFFARTATTQKLCDMYGVWTQDEVLLIEKPKEIVPKSSTHSHMPLSPKYRVENLSAANVDAFFADWEAGRLPRYLFSTKRPPPVRKIESDSCSPSSVVIFVIATTMVIISTVIIAMFVPCIISLHIEHAVRSRADLRFGNEPWPLTLAEGAATLSSAGVSSGQTLQGQKMPRLFATRRAIALLEHTGSVWCWGMAHYGGAAVKDNSHTEIRVLATESSYHGNGSVSVCHFHCDCTLDAVALLAAKSQEP
ncbi:HERC1 [Symbiodinium sp. CCMP2456]|nr:HERC1 [Symbiodinium sp. CCMP2456]